MRHRRVLHAVAVLALVFSAAGCRYQQSKATWEKVLARCGAKEALAGGVFYGPSDQVGPGSVWRRTDTGSYRMRWSIVEVKDASPLPAEAGKETPCKETRFTVDRVFPSEFLRNPLQPLDDGLEADLDKVDKVNVRIRSWAVDRLAENPYGGMLKALSPGSLLRKDLGREAIMAQASGLRVNGFAMSLEFSPGDAANLKKKYKDLSIKSRKAGASFTAKWVSSNVLELSADKDIYLFGRLSLITSSVPQLKLSAPQVINVFGPEYEDPRQPLPGESR